MENKVKLVVVKSLCSKYKVGDEIVFDGALIDKEHSASLCMMALSAVFPFVYAARKGTVRKAPVQCPDCGEGVEFEICVTE